MNKKMIIAVVVALLAGAGAYKTVLAARGPPEVRSLKRW